MHTMYVVTHPHAEHTASGLVGGWYDSSLTDQGRHDAHAIARELHARTVNNSRPLRVTTSDLRRCTATASAIGQVLGLQPTADRRLREISFGEAEGKPTAWLAEREAPAPDDSRLDHRGPLDGAETRREVATRVRECVEELIADDTHDHIVVTHGYAQTFVITAWLQLPVDAVGFAAFSPKPGSITHLTLDDYWRNRSVVSLADTIHLNR